MGGGIQLNYKDRKSSESKRTLFYIKLTNFVVNFNYKALEIRNLKYKFIKIYVFSKIIVKKEDLILNKDSDRIKNNK